LAFHKADATKLLEIKRFLAETPAQAPYFIESSMHVLVHKVLPGEGLAQADKFSPFGLGAPSTAFVARVDPFEAPSIADAFRVACFC
jgi:hypothetical protein